MRESFPRAWSDAEPFESQLVTDLMRTLGLLMGLTLLGSCTTAPEEIEPLRPTCERRLQEALWRSRFLPPPEWILEDDWHDCEDWEQEPPPLMEDPPPVPFAPGWRAVFSPL
jgi:hypothetical protein